MTWMLYVLAVPVVLWLLVGAIAFTVPDPPDREPRA